MKIAGLWWLSQFMCTRFTVFFLGNYTFDAFGGGICIPVCDIATYCEVDSHGNNLCVMSESKFGKMQAIEYKGNHYRVPWFVLDRLVSWETSHGRCPTCAGTRTLLQSSRLWASSCPPLPDCCSTQTVKFSPIRAGPCPTLQTEPTTRYRKWWTVVCGTSRAFREYPILFPDSLLTVILPFL